MTVHPCDKRYTQTHDVDVEQHIFIDLCAEDILASDPLACDWRASGKMSKIVFKRDRDSVNKWYLQLYIPCPRNV